MPNYTQNYNLEKPTEDEFYDVGVQNGNMDKLDETIASIDTAKAAAKNTIADGDSVSIVDSTDSSKTKRVLWSTIKSAMGQIFVPLTRKVNNKDLSADISLTGDDIATSATDGATVSSQLSNLEIALTTPPQEFDLPLESSFQNFLQEHSVYRKDQFGVVNLDISVQPVSEIAVDTVIAYLPEGFKPATNKRATAIAVTPKNECIAFPLFVGASGMVSIAFFSAQPAQYKAIIGQIEFVAAS